MNKPIQLACNLNDVSFDRDEDCLYLVTNEEILQALSLLSSTANHRSVLVKIHKGFLQLAVKKQQLEGQLNNKLQQVEVRLNQINQKCHDSCLDVVDNIAKLESDYVQSFRKCSQLLLAAKSNTDLDRTSSGPPIVTYNSLKRGAGGKIISELLLELESLLSTTSSSSSSSDRVNEMLRTIDTTMQEAESVIRDINLKLVG